MGSRLGNDTLVTGDLNLVQRAYKSSDRSLLVDPTRYFYSKSVIHNWFYECRGTYHPVSGMAHVKDDISLF